MIERTMGRNLVRSLARAAFTATVMMALGSTAEAQTRLWYYCSTTHQFYPYVQNCSVPWRAVHPYHAIPLEQPRNLVPQQDQAGGDAQETTLPGSPPGQSQEQSTGEPQDNAAPDSGAPQDQPDDTAPQEDQSAAPPKQAPNQSDSAASENPQPSAPAAQPSLPPSVVPTRDNPRAQASVGSTGDHVGSDILLFLLVAAVILALGTTPHFIKLYRNKIRVNKIREVMQNTVMQYKVALRRNCTQTLREDDFGILETKKWHEILSRFRDHRLEPEIQKLGPKTYAVYATMRASVFREMDEVIRRLPSSAPIFNLGPDNSGEDYERYCAELLRQAGWDARLTKGSGDQGADIIAEKGGQRLVAQCKFYFRQPVGNSAVQEAYTACKHMQGDWAAVVSNATYTTSAREVANTTGVWLLCHTDLEGIDALLSMRPQVPTSTDNVNTLFAEPSNVPAC